METTVDVLWYGRGGQGAFSAAKLLGASYAFAGDDNHVLAFPSFGPERRGAPVRAYTKLSHVPVNDRSAVSVPDFALCLDSTLLADFVGMQIKEGGFVLSTTPIIERFAAERLGRPIVNTTLLALLCAKTGLLSACDIQRGIEETMPARIQKKNVDLVYAVYSHVDELLEGALTEPAAQREPQPAHADLGFEYMDLSSAEAFGGSQRIYGAPSGKEDSR